MNRLIALVTGALLVAACTTEPPAPVLAPAPSPPAGPTNRIDIPPEVVRNLGIEFARVERRRVDRTVRLPGAFELPPQAERVYRMPVGGRVSALVQQYARVKPGDVIAGIDSPQWREIQQQLGDLESAASTGTQEHALATAQRVAAEADIAMYPQRVDAYGPRLEALEAHHKNLEATRDMWQARLASLEELAAKGAGRASEIADARGNLAGAVENLSSEEETHADLRREIEMLKLAEQSARNNLLVLEAAEKAAAARADSARAAFELRLRGAASTLGLSHDALKDGAWRTLDRIEVKASEPGLVLNMLASEDELLESGAELCHVINDRNLRFRARGLQSDLHKLRDGLDARVLPPSGIADAQPASGAITLAPMADADARLLDVLLNLEQAPPWARPGFSAELEIVWDAAAEPTLAIPNRALIRDGLEIVFFRRDEADPNKVIRVPAALGVSDGRWTQIYTGVMEGSEVVVEGTYELKLTGGGKSNVKGHFHADGTFHAEGTPEPGG